MTMSKYTTQLRWPIEQRLKDLQLDNDEANWLRCWKLLGLDDYPIFEETHRAELNMKIIRRYYFREIGFETMGQFRWMMRRTMHEIMPYYNQLYATEGLITDPLLSTNKDYSEAWTRDEVTNTDGTTRNDSSGSSTNDSRNVFQDTPMNGLDTGAIQNMDYATNVTFDHATASSQSNTSGASSSDYKGDFEGTKQHNEKGYDKSQSELLNEYRDTFLNIDLEIVDRLNPLFMGLW